MGKRYHVSISCCRCCCKICVRDVFSNTAASCEIYVRDQAQVGHRPRTAGREMTNMNIFVSKARRPISYIFSCCVAIISSDYCPIRTGTYLGILLGIPWYCLRNMFSPLLLTHWNVQLWHSTAHRSYFNIRSFTQIHTFIRYLCEYYSNTLYSFE